jgi:hypothetical protein
VRAFGRCVFDGAFGTAAVNVSGWFSCFGAQAGYCLQEEVETTMCRVSGASSCEKTKPGT